MEPPIKPEESDCCNSGCNPCILDVYEAQLKKYNDSLKQSSTAASDSLPNCINPSSYSVFKLVGNKKHTKDTALLTFQYCRPFRISEASENSSSKTNRLWYKPGQHFLLKATYKNRSEMFTRAYTPIPIEVGDVENSLVFTILVRFYKNGEMSRYLRNLELGKETLWRGPYGNYEINYTYKDMLLIAQGTGIAPILSVISDMLNNEDCYTFLNLFFCCRSCDDILLREELYKLTAYWNFKYVVFLSDGRNSAEKFNEVIHKRKLEEADVKKFIENKSAGGMFVLICGSEGFSETVRGYIVGCDRSDKNIFIF